MLFLSSAKPEAADGDEESAVASWELRVEGRLLDEAKVALELNLSYDFDLVGVVG